MDQDMTAVTYQLSAAASLTGHRQPSNAVVAHAGRHTHPPHNDVRQAQRCQFGNQHVMVECFSKIDEDCAHRLALVNGNVPVVQHVDQCMCCRPLSEGAIMPVIQAIAKSLQNPWPNK